MNNDEDLYNDLPDETTSDYIAKIENQLEAVQKQYDDSQTFIKQLTAEKHNQEKRIKELEKIVEDLERNMSSLYKTAIAEIKRKDNMLNELRVENDEFAFRRHNKLTNCDRDRSRDGRNNRERHKDISPIEEKFKRRVRCKKQADGRSRRDERQRFEVEREKSDSSERSDHRNGEFYSRERHHKSLPKMADVRERHSISPRDRIGNSFGSKNGSEVRNEHRTSQNKHARSQITSSIKNDSEVQTSSQYDRNEYRSSKDVNLKSQIISSIKHGSEVQTSSQYDKNEHRSSRDTHIKSQINWSMKNCLETQTRSQCDKNEHRSSKDIHLKPQIISNIKQTPEDQTSSQYDKNEHRSNKDMLLKSQIIPSIKNGPEAQTSTQCDKNENRSNKNTHLKSKIIPSINNGPETQTSSQCDENEHRSSRDTHLKSQIMSSIKNGPEALNSSQNVKNQHRSSQDINLKSHVISSIKNGPEALTSSQNVKNEHRSSQDVNFKFQTISSIKNGPEALPISQNVKNEHRNSQDILKSQTISSIKNGPEVQTSSQNIKNDYRSRLDRILKSQTISSIKNGPETLTSSQNIENDHRSIQDLRPKSQTISSIKNGPETSTSSQNIENDHRSIQDLRPKSQTISSIKNGPEMQTSSQNVKNELQSSQNKYPKPQITSSNTKKKSESKLTAPDQNKSPSGRIDKPPCVSTIGENTSTSIDTRTEICTNIKKNSVTVPDRKKLNSHGVDRLEALFATDDSTSLHNTPYSDENENQTLEKEKETRGQRNGYLRCEAALRSMKKKSFKLLTPIKDTPDLLKEKFSQIENNKINPVIPMINERRMLSPYKNVAVVEIVCEYDNESESSKPTESETVTTCSVTVSEDIEHGVFSRKNRKRPRIQKIITGVKKVATC